MVHVHLQIINLLINLKIQVLLATIAMIVIASIVQPL